MPEIVGSAYRQLKSLIKKYAQNDYPVLLTGEPGSGKELFARYYMNSSERVGETRTVNCAAVPQGVLESEVFGHVKGAFTGAAKDRKGLIETCEKGILFLDELGEASPHFQAAILRVSEGNTFKPVGSNDEKSCNTLIIAATNNPGKIRDDLKTRFQILPIPPLQKPDIPSLAAYFLGKPFKKAILEELMTREYPGNIRELRKYCERLKTERGNKILSNRKANLTIGVSNFDYDRYRRELETWDKHIQPLIDEHGPKELEYTYMDWDSSWMDFKSTDRNLGKFLPAKRLVHGNGKANSMYVHGTLDLIEWLRMGAHTEEKLPPLNKDMDNYRFQIQNGTESQENLAFLQQGLEKAQKNLEDVKRKQSAMSTGPMDPRKKKELEEEEMYVHQDIQMWQNRIKGNEVIVKAAVENSRLSPKEVVPNFRKHMREYFDRAVLPYLLEQVDQRYILANPMGVTEKPALSHILEMTPPKQAAREFERVYFNYHLQKYHHNTRKTAEALSIPPKTLYSRIRKLRQN